MLPFYIYYSMFGFQRVGDAIWAAADQRARGFLLGATSGRTTLGGEGLQHKDGSSPVIAATIPNCKAYDPAYASELAIILDHGMRDMMVEQKDVFYYITLMNENYAQHYRCAGKEADIIQGGYHFGRWSPTPECAIQDALPISLLASGAIFPEALAAATTLQEQGYTVDLFSITSWSELARQGQQCWEQSGSKERAHIHQLLQHARGPVIATSDYVRAVPESIRAFIPEHCRYTCLGTDGFGRSDTRQQLRSYFGVDQQAIVKAALQALA